MKINIILSHNNIIDYINYVKTVTLKKNRKKHCKIDTEPYIFNI